MKKLTFRIRTMDDLKRIGRKKLIGSIYEKTGNMASDTPSSTLKKMGVSKTTTYRILKECDEGCPMQRNSGSGRPAKKMKKVRVLAMLRYLRVKWACPRDRQPKNLE